MTTQPTVAELIEKHNLGYTPLHRERLKKFAIELLELMRFDPNKSNSSCKENIYDALEELYK